MRRRRILGGVGLLGGILALVGIPIGIIERGLYQDKLDRRLVSAVKAHDTTTAIRMLSLGADANARDDPPRSVSSLQMLLEALHIKQKPRLSGASVLLPALDWRPEPDSKLSPVTGQAALIQEFRDYGVRWDGPEIAANMVRTYVYCASYQDTGTLTMSDPSNGLSFHTAFIRPDHLLLEGKPLGKRSYDPFLLFQNDHGVVCGNPSRKLTHTVTLYEGIHEAGGTS